MNQRTIRRLWGITAICLTALSGCAQDPAPRATKTPVGQLPPKEDPSYDTLTTNKNMGDTTPANEITPQSQPFTVQIGQVASVGGSNSIVCPAGQSSCSMGIRLILSPANTQVSSATYLTSNTTRGTTQQGTIQGNQINSLFFAQFPAGLLNEQAGIRITVTGTGGQTQEASASFSYTSAGANYPTGGLNCSNVGQYVSPYSAQTPPTGFGGLLKTLGTNILKTAAAGTAAVACQTANNALGQGIGAVNQQLGGYSNTNGYNQNSYSTTNQYNPNNNSLQNYNNQQQPYAAGNGNYYSTQQP